jgi:hypothetical protein
MTLRRFHIICIKASPTISGYGGSLSDVFYIQSLKNFYMVNKAICPCFCPLLFVTKKILYTDIFSNKMIDHFQQTCIGAYTSIALTLNLLLHLWEKSVGMPTVPIGSYATTPTHASYMPSFAMYYCQVLKPWKRCAIVLEMW